MGAAIIFIFRRIYGINVQSFRRISILSQAISVIPGKSLQSWGGMGTSHRLQGTFLPSPHRIGISHWRYLGCDFQITHSYT